MTPRPDKGGGGEVVGRWRCACNWWWPQITRRCATCGVPRPIEEPGGGAEVVKEAGRCDFCGALHVGMCSPATLRRAYARLRSERDALEEALREIFELNYHEHQRCYGGEVARAALARLTAEREETPDA